jgi:HPt (histidine-containing phosphotransfer) domain-containing protein
VQEAASDGQVFNISQLFESAADDRELARDLCAQFLESADEAWGRVLTAIQRGDAPAVEQAAHSLKGSCWVIGAEALGAALQDLETAAKSGAVAALGHLVTAADRERARLLPRLTPGLHEEAA